MKIRKIGLVVIALLSIISLSSFGKNSKSLEKTNQVVRTAKYTSKSIDEDSLFLTFDSHEIKKDEDSINVIAKKNYSKELLEELDLVSLDSDSDELTLTYEVNYVIEESMVYLSVRYDSLDGEEDIVDVLPGLYTLNENGDEDVMFKDGEDVLWLSDIENYSVIDNTGLWNLVRKVIKKIVETPVVREVANTIAKAVAPIIRYYVTKFYLAGVGPIAAWIGGTALDMYQEWKQTDIGLYVPTGIYHAKFDCWQKEVGYDDFYDEIFDNGTSIAGRKRMERHKYEIDINGDKISDYILWAWKGDYYNLGAGCEIGIYERVEDDNYGLVWKCAKSKAFNCTIKLKYNNISLIDWNNNGNKHWWFTGFNSNYQFPLLWNVDNLTATFEVTFNCFNNQSDNDKMYNSFVDNYELYKNDPTEYWKFWTLSGSTMYNGIVCHRALLSF